MTKKWIETLVGGLMLAGALALSMLAFKVSGIQVGSNDSYYHVTADFENVGSLQTRSKISLSGLIIGEVSQIEYVPEDFTARVTLKIKSNYDNLPIDSTAAILTQGMLGDQYIGLSVGAEEELLEDGSVIEETQSALVLEELIGAFLLSMTKE
ncbi:MAG: outer membrane lipid asymmetry maintenance protein MlaD [Pseudomonadales bacterium]|nr:outer membrane lipid asymmetry maintenance protein MlaD [Pseudomonadales bacterium]